MAKSLVICENCGKEFLKRNDRIKKHKHHFCSKKCLGYYTAKKNTEKIIGNTYGKLTVLSFECVKKQYSFVMAKCECGNYKIIRLSSLKSGNTKSCGNCIPDKERFMSFVEIINENLWIWKGGRSKGGYGIFAYKGKSIGAHRASYILFKGEIPKGLYVLHEDDRRDNVCPKILRLGSLQDNHKDMVSKDRHIKGKDCHSAVLTEDKVIELRKMYKTGNYSQTKLSNIFGIKQCTVSQIITRKSWSHI